jgi:hypothetical protein
MSSLAKRTFVWLRSNIVVFATVFPPSLTLLPMAVTDVNC